MKEKERLDVLLTERGFFESREKAKAAVMAGSFSSRTGEWIKRERKLKFMKKLR